MDKIINLIIQHPFVSGIITIIIVMISAISYAIYFFGFRPMMIAEDDEEDE